VFGQKVYNQGPTFIIVKTKLGAICGGFTSMSWGGSNSYAYDHTAFVFNLKFGKFIPTSSDKVIYLVNDGFRFGNCMF
jgi:hypothetical protein